jgi:hypothetical protein
MCSVDPILRLLNSSEPNRKTRPTVELLHIVGFRRVSVTYSSSSSLLVVAGVVCGVWTPWELNSCGTTVAVSTGIRLLLLSTIALSLSKSEFIFFLYERSC